MPSRESTAVDAAVADPQRLRALSEYRILDTPPEAAFDDIARLAAAICKAPIALINFIDAERQFFKAAVGFDAATPPLELSLCVQALDGPDLLVIPDTREDDRCRDNPQVRVRGGIRFYAGALLRTVDGHALGTLCVIDEQPRDLTEHQRSALASLAMQVMAQLELRRTVAQLLQSQGEFAAAFNQVLLGMVVADLEGKVVRANDAFCRIVGRPLHEILGRDSRSYTHPEDLQKNLTKIRLIEREDVGSTVYEKRYVRPDGQSVLVQISLSAVKNEKDKLVCMIGAVEDITERRLAEQRDKFLIDLDDAVRTLTDPREIANVSARLVATALDASRCAYTEYNRLHDTYDLVGDFNDGVVSIAGPYPAAQFSAECQRMLLAGQTFRSDDVEHDPATADARGAFRLSEIRSIVSVPLHRHGRLAAVMSLHRASPQAWAGHEMDLLHRVAKRCWESIEHARVTRAMQISGERYRVLTMTVSAVVWVTDSQGMIISDNPSWGWFTGQSEAEYRGWGWLDAVHPDDRANASRLWNAAVAGKSRYEAYYRLRRFDGEYRDVVARGAPVIADDGSVKEWVGNCADITEQRRAEAERERLLDSERAARSEAERASHLKDEFLATLSHELRTPLNAILGWAQVLRRTGATGGGEDFAHGMEAIERNARVQTQLIEDLLDMSRIVSGKLRLNVERLEMADVVNAAVDAVGPTARQKQVRLETLLDGPASVLGDAARLQQVVWNLLTNAVKFTPAGGRVLVRMERADPYVRISVSDTGKGIRREFLPFVFERFRQADSSTTRQHGGLGLGLALVKQLAEMHGGSVAVSSDGEEQGATFVVSLPLPVARHEGYDGGLAAEADGGVDLSGISVLVVDDEPDARNLARRLLEECRAVVSTAGNAAEAFEALRNGRPDVVVSDIGMPGEDGYTFIRRVRALPPDEGGRTPAAALTAFARSDDRRRALVAGFQSHITKPVEPMELVAVVASLAGRSGGGGGVQMPTPSAD